MTKIKILAGGLAATAVGVGIGLSNVSAGDAEPAITVADAHFVLDPVAAVQPELPPEPESPPEPSVLKTIAGSASFYANSLAGRRTASGVPYNPREMVAAHPSLPFGSLLRVTNESNGKTVKVRVVDRGPFARGRVLDLSRVAAERLDFIRQGHTRVTIEVLEEVEEG